MSHEENWFLSWKKKKGASVSSMRLVDCLHLLLDLFSTMEKPKECVQVMSSEETFKTYNKHKKCKDFRGCCSLLNVGNWKQRDIRLSISCWVLTIAHTVGCLFFVLPKSYMLLCVHLGYTSMGRITLCGWHTAWFFTFSEDAEQLETMRLVFYSENGGSMLTENSGKSSPRRR